MSASLARRAATGLVFNVLRVAWSALGAVAGIAAFIGAASFWNWTWMNEWHLPIGSAAIGAVGFTRLWTVVHARLSRRAPSDSTVA